MRVTDTIADALTRIRNAIQAHHSSVEIPSSKLKISILKILQDEGFIKKFITFDNGHQGSLKVFLKYNQDKSSVIRHLRRVSKSGMRIYSKAGSLPRVIGGLGIALISTSKGIMTDKQARSMNLGGEVLAYIW